MSFLEILLLCLLYFFGSSTSWTFGIGYYTLYRPVIAGGLSGLILGDITTGFFIGALVNIVYLNFSSTGGSLKGDGCLMSIIAVCTSFIMKTDAIQSLAIAWPFGLLGIFIWKYRLRINMYFVKRFRQSISENDNIKNRLFIYNALQPQVLLLLACSLIIAFSIFLLELISGLVNFSYISYITAACGLILIWLSLITQLTRLNNIKKAFLFISCLLLSLLNINIVLIACIAVTLVFVLYDYIKINKYRLATESKLKKHDLIGCWSKWMNFCHACYNFEVMQGLGFSHSMEGVLSRLYPSDEKRKDRILYYTEYFNVEPNIGTPILGYTVAREEKINNENDENDENDENEESSDINYMRKAMMGIVSGLGDSLTQTVITPVFISICIAFALMGNIILAAASALVLAAIIIYISYTGFIKGYLLGRNGLMERVNEVKKSIFNKYSFWLQIALAAIIFAGIVLYIPLFSYDISIITISLVISVLLHIFTV